jgi:site-specific recombinase
MARVVSLSGSFTIALLAALRAQAVSARGHLQLLKMVLRSLVKSPGNFLFLPASQPQGGKMPPAAES